MIESVRSRRTTLTEAIVQKLQRAVQGGLFPHGCQIITQNGIRGIVVRRHDAGTFMHDFIVSNLKSGYYP